MEGDFGENGSSPKSDVPKKYTCLKTPSRRAYTWEISDSESESNGETWTDASSTEVNSSPGVVKARACKTAEASQKCFTIGDDASVVARPLPIPPLSSPAKKLRKKRATEELESDRAEAQKLGRETKRLEKERAKELARLERETKRLEKEQQKELEMRERQRRKEMSEALKFLRPDQCVKHMSVCVDTGILEDAGSDELLAHLSASECRFFIESQPVPHSITWRREMPPGWSGVSGMEVKDGEEEEMLVLVGPEVFLKSIYSLRKGSEEVPPGPVSVSDQGFAFDIPDRHPEKNICLIVIGLETYQWYIKRSQQGGDQSRGRGRGTRCHPEHSVTQRQIEEALVVLQLWSHTDVLFVDTWLELGQHVASVTKAIAQRPFKRYSENQAFSFCTTEGGWTSGVRVEKDGRGLRQAWKRQIQQFNRVSPSMAAAVFVAYPSPRLLLQAYEQCSTEREKLNLLTGLEVRKEVFPAREHKQDPDSLIKETEDNQGKGHQDSLAKQESQSTHSLCKEESRDLESLWKEERQGADSLGKEERQGTDSLVKEENSNPGSLLKEESQDLDSMQEEESSEDTGRKRRLGPDLSRRIYTFMVATNPDLVLDLGS